LTFYLPNTIITKKETVIHIVNIVLQ